VITGSRAEYGIMKLFLKKIKKNKNLDLSIIATATHLDPVHGYTINDIENDGFSIDYKVDMMFSNKTRGALAKSLGTGIIGITQALENLKPDVVILFGDRPEVLSATIASTYLQILTAHIQGGDHAAGYHIDDSNRLAISKLSHIHFPAIEEHQKYLIKIGEDPKRIHVVGSLGLDEIVDLKNSITEEIKEDIVKKYEISLSEPFLIVINHPVYTEVEKAGNQMRILLNSIEELKIKTLIIYPSQDPGSEEIISVIKDYVNRFPWMCAYKSIPRKDFLILMNLASAMVGNSSSGIIETGSLGLPTVNIGRRQEGRIKPANVLNVDYNLEDIKVAIKKAIYDDDFKKKSKEIVNPYGDGNTSDKIIQIIENLKDFEKLFIKY
jgi:UDP-N-acetylglucosamine 2-epimerase (non-hydrolysing)/GDP/UDP-N,N'-diacetylbacillosamine 2-epimerase (hydrolysing)